MAPTRHLGSLASRAPMPVIGVDRDGRVIYVNDSLSALVGYDRGELLGEFFWDFITGPTSGLRRRRFLDLRDEGVDTRFDAEIRTRDGGGILVAWHNVSFFDDDGRLESVFSIGADVTALRTAERRLERLNAALRALGEVSRIALRTDDPGELLDRACASLVDAGACTGAWIAPVGDDGRPVGLVGSSLSNGTSPDRLQAAMRELPECIAQVLSGPRQVAITDITEACASCPFVPDDRDVHGIVTTVCHGERARAVLVAHVPNSEPVGEEMKQVFAGIADDLGFALAMLEARVMHERTERSLAERTRLLDAFFETSLDPAAILDRDFNFLRVNEAYAAADEREPHEFIGQNHFDLYPNEENQAIFERVRDTGEPYDASARPFDYPEAPERGTTWWDWSLVPIHDEAGEVELLSFWLRDVTEQQRARRRLERQRDFVDAVIEGAGSLVIVVNSRGQIVRFNRAAEEVSGYSADDVRGQDFVDTLVPPEDREQVRADFMETFGAGLADYENWWLCADGSRRRISWRIAIIADESGGDRYAVGTGWDVTEERRMARELRESEEKYRELVENARTAIIRWDLDGTIRFVNEYGLELFGHCEEEIVGEHVSLIIPDMDRDGVELTGLVEAIAGNPEDYWVNENENVAKDGTRYWMSWSNRVVRDDAGEVIGIMAIGVDRTAEREAEDELRASQEDLRELTAELAMAEQRERREIATALHDNVGQLLAFAKMKLSSIPSAQTPGDGDIDEVLRYVDEAIGETRAMTSQLSPPVLSELGFASALRWLVGEMDDRHEPTIAFDCAGDVPEGLSEELSITLFQATRELITNAIKHAEARQVNVRLWVKDSEVCVRVADDGRGFDPHTLSERRQRERTFGLLNVRERISYLGGGVDINSAPGEGASITLICPTAAKESSIS